MTKRMIGACVAVAFIAGFILGTLNASPVAGPVSEASKQRIIADTVYQTRRQLLSDLLQLGIVSRPQYDDLEKKVASEGFSVFGDSPSK